MRLLSLAGLWSFLLTFGAVSALRADSPVLAVAALAALAAAVTWFAAQYSDDAIAGATTTGTGATIALTVSGRSPVPLLLPLVAAQVVGAVAAGGLALALGDSLEPSLAWREPNLVTMIAMGVFIGLVGGWLIVFIDGYLSEGVAALPVLLGGGLLAVGYALAFHPAVLVGLAVAGVTEWSTSLTVGGAVLVGTAIAGFSLSLLVPPKPSSVQNADA